MKIIKSDIINTIPDIRESDFLKYVIVSIVGSYASYVIKDTSGYRLKGVRTLFDNEPIIWQDSFNVGSSTILDILQKDGDVTACQKQVIYFIDNWKDLLTIKHHHTLPTKFCNELKIALRDIKGSL